MYHPRAIEPWIKQYQEQFPILLLTGPRQVGKSTVLSQVAGDRYTKVTMDDPLLRQQVGQDPALFLKNNPPPLLLDEVQYVPELFPHLKMLADREQRDGLILMTGSQAFALMRHVSESLAGRVGILRLQGISLRERFDIAFNQPFIPDETYLNEREGGLKPYEHLWDIIHRGYMPKLAFNPDNSWEIYYASYVETYIQRDVKQLAQVTDEGQFLRFMTALAARSGELLNYQSVGSEIGISNDTAKRWVSILETSGIVYLLYPYSNNHLKRVLKTPKIYFLDTGLLAYLTRWPTSQTLMNGAKAGQVFETFVVSEVIKSFYNAGKSTLPLYYYRDRDGREIDLVIEQGDTVYPVEIKMTAAPNRHMARSFDALDGITGIKLGTGVILCQYERKMWLADDLLSLPLEYI